MCGVSPPPTTSTSQWMGSSWWNIGSNSLTSLSALNYIGSGGASNSGSSGDLYTTFDFFRVSTDTGLDAPVNGQAVGIYAAP